MTHRPAVAVILGALLCALPLRAQPGAFELLDQVRNAYQALASYRDHGEIEIVEAVDGSLRRRALRFATVVHGDAFRLLVETAQGRWILSREGGQVRLDGLELGQYRRLGSVAAGLVEVIGRDGFDALVVAAALAGSPAALADPEGAAVDGEEPCGQAACYVLLLSRMKSAIETKMWVDRESLLIRRLEVVVHPAGDEFRQALADAGLGPSRGALSGPAPSRTFRVRHEIGSGDAFTTLAAEFVPPAAARRVEEWEAPAAEPGTATAAVPERESRPELAFDDEISVGLSRLVVRVVDSRGQPLPGLEPADFRVLFAGAEIPVAAVDWVSSHSARRHQDLLAELAAGGVVLPPAEKLVIFFVQAGLQAMRIKGHLRTLPFARDLVATLAANDRAAVVSFDSHLKLWLDFTRRHEQVADALGQAIRFGGQPWLRRGRAGAGLYLAEHLDLRAARDAATPEQALRVVGEALGSIPGDKVMVYLGWGMGRYTAEGVKMTGDYDPAVAALKAARTAVFVLDVTDAGYHSLELGLRNVAAQTGGTYAKTSLFARQATDRLARTLTGHYVLMLSEPDLPARPGVLRVKLREKKGRVIGARFLVDVD